jgi:hypothetical protein
LWRISFDFWDRWHELYNQFGNLQSHSPYRGPGHWPDADMLPLGHLKTWETNNYTKFTRDEQFTVITLWSIARSPMIMGGHMPDNDEFTLGLMTNDEVIAVNQASTNNKQLFNTNNQVAWVADVPRSKEKYVALFNTSPAPPPGAGRRGPGGFGGPGGPGGQGLAPTNAPGAAPTNIPVVNAATNAPVAENPAAKLPVKIAVSLAEIGLSGDCAVRDLWARRDLGIANDEVSAMVNSHGAVLLKVTPRN